MKYKSYNGNVYNIYTIKTNKFKTVHLEVLFRKEVTKDDWIYTFLSDILGESSKKYPRRKDMAVRLEELYKSSIYFNTSKTGNVINFSLVNDFIAPVYINDDNYVEEVINMAFELLEHPNVTDDEFDFQTFNMIKLRMEKAIDSIIENPIKQSIKEAFKTMDSNSPTSYDMLGSKEDLETLTPSILYKAYKRLYKDFTCDIFVIGDIDMDNLVSIIKKNFKKRYICEDKLNLIVDNKYKSNIIKKSKESNNTQASLVMLYNLVNLSKEEKDITMGVYNYILGSGGLTSKLYQSLREKNSLCYGVSSMYLKYDNILVIQISLDNSNVSKAIKLVKNDIKSMGKGDFLDSDVLDAVNNIMTSLDMSEDNNMSLLNNYVFNIYDEFPFLDERRKMLKNIDRNKIITISNKVKLNTIYVLKGKGEL